MDVWQWTAPLVGGAILEVVHWHQLRESLDEPKYAGLLRSGKYWAVTVAMVLAGGVLGWFWAQSKDEAPSPFELLVAGAAAPSLLKAGISSFLSGKGETRLGDDAAAAEAGEPRVSLRSYFLPGG
ncbi:hypothetical protein [Nocardioides sp. YIM 152315]|uniref:hypothetical protein n=1 Tax=Nocardioides sp. YIM 152315 TaxID=3031760 RepID=UPI0023DA7A2C|nr:hypothetical protein [Nocardioides sp. YIM 152315]MDF1605031.1 hypothetical protein [Nocardioides sp. YIM 152315]